MFIRPALNALPHGAYRVIRTAASVPPRASNWKAAESRASMEALTRRGSALNVQCACAKFQSLSFVGGRRFVHGGLLAISRR
jgi:hypothetical protein